jgi:hypothetical protein
MRLENTVHNRDILAGDPVDGDVARLVALVRRVDEEEEVTAVEGRLHGAAGVLCCAREKKERNASVRCA